MIKFFFSLKIVYLASWDLSSCLNAFLVSPSYLGSVGPDKSKSSAQLFGQEVVLTNNYVQR